VVDIRIGTSGWNYPHWRNDFYPKGLTQRRELEYLAGRMNTVEINGSFYSLQRPSSYRLWRATTPPDFVFAVKGGRFITHNKKLLDVRIALANFFSSGPLALEEKLGPFLWQLPPVLRFLPERMEEFFMQLPQTVGRACELATEHDDRLSNRFDQEPVVATEVLLPDQYLRHAVEVRHPSFVCDEFFDLCRRFGIAVVPGGLGRALSLDRASHRRFRLCPAARFTAVVCQPLHRGGDWDLGGQNRGLVCRAGSRSRLCVF